MRYSDSKEKNPSRDGYSNVKMGSFHLLPLKRLDIQFTFVARKAAIVIPAACIPLELLIAKFYYSTVLEAVWFRQSISLDITKIQGGDRHFHGLI
jgi:hypothetical protein